MNIPRNINIFRVPLSTTKRFSSLNFQDNKLIQQFRRRFPKRSLQEQKFSQTPAFVGLENVKYESTI